MGLSKINLEGCEVIFVIIIQTYSWLFSCYVLFIYFLSVCSMTVLHSKLEKTVGQSSEKHYYYHHHHYYFILLYLFIHLNNSWECPCCFQLYRMLSNNCRLHSDSSSETMLLPAFSSNLSFCLSVFVIFDEIKTAWWRTRLIHAGRWGKHWTPSCYFHQSFSKSILYHEADTVEEILKDTALLFVTAVCVCVWAVVDSCGWSFNYCCSY